MNRHGQDEDEDGASTEESDEERGLFFCEL